MDLQDAIRQLDIEFGKGYGKKHPEQVIEFMKAHGLNTLQYQLEPVVSNLIATLDKSEINDRILQLIEAMNLTFINAIKDKA